MPANGWANPSIDPRRCPSGQSPPALPGHRSSGQRRRPGLGRISPAAPPSTPVAGDPTRGTRMGWLAATDGYEVALVDRKLACRRGGGRALKTVPRPVRDHDVAQGLMQTQEWLDRHDLACRAEV